MRTGRSEERVTGAEMDDAAIYAAHAVELTRFATMLVGPSGAEDVVADAMVRAMSSAAWSRVRSKRAYLYRVVLRQAQSSRRSAQRRLTREMRVASREAQGDPSADLSLDAIRALAALTVRQRAVVFMTHWLDATPDQIAGLIGVASRTVQRDLAAAYRHMEEHLT